VLRPISSSPPQALQRTARFAISSAENPDAASTWARIPSRACPGDVLESRILEAIEPTAGTRTCPLGQRPWFSDQTRDGTEFARRDLRGRAVCCAVPSLGRPSTNQVGLRGWEANRENRSPRRRVSTPPSQQASLGALRSALRRREGPGRSKYSSRLVMSATQTHGKASPGRRRWLPHSAARCCSSRRQQSNYASHNGAMTCDTVIADATIDQGVRAFSSTGMAWHASQRRDFAVDYSPISPTTGRHLSVIIHAFLGLS
jgi:hypothetical protein